MSDTKTDWGRPFAGASLRTSTREGDSPTNGATDFFLSSKGLLSNHQNGDADQLQVDYAGLLDMNMTPSTSIKLVSVLAAFLGRCCEGTKLPTFWSLGGASIFTNKPFLQHHRIFHCSAGPYLLKPLVTCFSTTSN
ncbi:MAG: hypothetical protein O9341_06490 [Paucibacter sp.]|nr:hypothetical protein [Roseateles sp.]